MSIVVCFLWGYLLYTGNIERLWRVMGIANQLLATIALAVGTTYLLTYATKRIYALITAVPFAFTVVTVFVAGVKHPEMVAGAEHRGHHPRAGDVGENGEPVGGRDAAVVGRHHHRRRTPLGVDPQPRSKRGRGIAAGHGRRRELTSRP